MNSSKSDHIQKFDMMLCGREDDSLLGRLDDVLQQMKQDGRLVVSTTLKKRQLQTTVHVTNGNLTTRFTLHF